MATDPGLDCLFDHTDWGGQSTASLGGEQSGTECSRSGSEYSLPLHQAFPRRLSSDCVPVCGRNHLTWRVTHNGRIIFEHSPNKRTFPKNGRQPVGRRQRAFPAAGDLCCWCKNYGQWPWSRAGGCNIHCNICCKLCWQWSVHCWGGQHRIRWSKFDVFLTRTVRTTGTVRTTTKQVRVERIRPGMMQVSWQPLLSQRRVEYCVHYVVADALQVDEEINSVCGLRRIVTRLGTASRETQSFALTNWHLSCNICSRGQGITSMSWHGHYCLAPRLHTQVFMLPRRVEDWGWLTAKSYAMWHSCLTASELSPLI